MIIFALSICRAENTAQTIQRIELKAKIAELEARDQVVRKEICKHVSNGKIPNNLAAYLNQVDQNNYKQFKKIVVANDFLGLDDASIEHLWLLSQHADREPKFQKKMLSIFEKIAAKKIRNRKYYAYLYDRVQINQNCAQRYGTQGKCIGHRQWQPFLIENLARLNQRRVKVGLGKFAFYQAVMNKLCN
jgi:hypothetical protein